MAYRIRYISQTVHLVFSPNLLLKCSVKLHQNKSILKTNVTFREQLSWLGLLFEVMSAAILDTADLLTCDRC